MEPVLDVFTANELRSKSTDLFRDVENGQLALVTKRGRPAFLAIPFDEKLLRYGVNKMLAIYLFERGLLTLSQAAKIASVPLEEFIEFAGHLGIPMVDYPADELAEELERAL